MSGWEIGPYWVRRLYLSMEVAYCNERGGHEGGGLARTWVVAGVEGGYRFLSCSRRCSRSTTYDMWQCGPVSSIFSRVLLAPSKILCYSWASPSFGRIPNDSRSFSRILFRSWILWNSPPSTHPSTRAFRDSLDTSLIVLNNVGRDRAFLGSGLDDSLEVLWGSWLLHSFYALWDAFYRRCCWS